jgi:hypothetical protein
VGVVEVTWLSACHVLGMTSGDLGQRKGESDDKIWRLMLRGRDCTRIRRLYAYSVHLIVRARQYLQKQRRRML